MSLVYELLLILGLLAMVPAAMWRRRLPHRGWSMRLGRYPAPVRERLAGRRTIWVHAVSVGEVLAAQPLVEALLQAHPDRPLALSTVTPGGFDVIGKRFGDRVTRLYFPLDLRGCVRRSLEALRPSVLLLMESELWPMMVRSAHARAVPVLVVNGRVSPRAFRRLLAVRRWATPWLQEIDQWLMQSREDADRIIELGVASGRVQVTGSLKWDASRSTRPPAEAVRALAARVGVAGDDPVIVAGSTHRGEEAAVLAAFGAVRASHPRARLILAPRHLERLPEVEGIVRRAGLAAARLSAAALDGSTVGLVDTFGQLPQYYALASVVFIGGSLIPHGGQNPLEAASLGKPVVFGPSMHNFAVIAHQLLAHHAARQVSRSAELPGLLLELLADPAAASAMGQQAKALTERFQGATARTLEAVTPWLQGGREWPAGYG